MTEEARIFVLGIIAVCQVGISFYFYRALKRQRKWADHLLIQRRLNLGTYTVYWTISVRDNEAGKDWNERMWKNFLQETAYADRNNFSKQKYNDILTSSVVTNVQIVLNQPKV